MTPGAPVTVVVPVYRGADDVERCLASVVRHVSTSDVAPELLVIDDASPEPDVTERVDAVARTADISVTVMRNDENVGFVRAVNRGLRAARGDVVILNSDTVVTAGWLDRLHDAAQSRPDVATVTPLTGFGSICTLPPPVVEAFALRSPDPRVEECAAFVLRCSLQLRPEVVTGVGFCMYVTRDALDACGELDEETFGIGYGEEVDFCLRATRLGFVHLVEDSTFVHHTGGASFGEARADGLARGSELLHDRYRYFRAVNAAERAREPLETSFASLELGLAERDGARRHVLHVLHSPPDAVGGTEKHLRALVQALIGEMDFSVLYPVSSGFGLHTMWADGTGGLIEHDFLLPGAAHQVAKIDDEVAGIALQMALDAFDVDAVHVQNLIGHSLAPLRVLADLPGPVVCSVRDLYLACPNHSLLYLDEQACGIPDDPAVCARCLNQTRGLPIEHLERHRATVRAWLDTVDTWVFASQSASDYFLRAYDIGVDRIEIIEHGALVAVDPAVRALDERRVLRDPLRVAFVGMGTTKKGLGVVNEIADDLAAAGSTVELHHFGEMKEDPSPAIRLHGTYDNKLLPSLLRDAGIHIVMLPGPYAETFGHVMTEALAAGIPVIGARYGALGERVRTHRCGWTIDPEDALGVRRLLENVDRCRVELLRATRAASSVPIASVAQTANRYASLYRRPKLVGRTHKDHRNIRGDAS